MRSALLASLVSGSILFATPGHAVGVSVLGTGVEMDETGYAQLVQLALIAKQGMDALQTAKETLQTGADTLSTLREINAAVQSTVYLAQNPDEILNQAREGFLLSFSELEAINREAIALNQEVRSGPNGFDANAYRRAYDSARNTIGGFELFLAAREKDYGALSEAHLIRTAGIEATLTEDRQIQKRVNAMTSMNQKEAASISAKADVDTAVSTAVTAQSVSDMLRLQKLEAAEREKERFEAEAIAAERKEAARKQAENANNALNLQLAPGDDLAGDQ